MLLPPGSHYLTTHITGLQGSHVDEFDPSYIHIRCGWLVQLVNQFPYKALALDSWYNVMSLVRDN